MPEMWITPFHSRGRRKMLWAVGQKRDMDAANAAPSIPTNGIWIPRKRQRHAVGILPDDSGIMMRLGKIESAALKAISTLGDGTYGVPIHVAIEEQLGRFVSLGSMYVALERLEEAGLIESWEELGGPERDYRKKRCFRLIDTGFAVTEGP